MGKFLKIENRIHQAWPVENVPAGAAESPGRGKANAAESMQCVMWPEPQFSVGTPTTSGR